jgi:hypothetical protein
MSSPRRRLRQRKRYAEDAAFRDKLRKRVRAYCAAKKEAIKARRQAKRADPEFLERFRRRQTCRIYGMLPEDYAALMARQGGVCAICGDPGDPLCIDHCHDTGRVRGLLCDNCNVGLGMYRDSKGRLRGAIAYLDRAEREPSLALRALGARPRRRSNRSINKQKGNSMVHDGIQHDGAAILQPQPSAVHDMPSVAASAFSHPDIAAEDEFAPLDLDDLLALAIPERGMVLDPIIPEKGLALLYAMRGTGKTHVALGIAHAVATGTAFLTWRVPQPRRVLLVDGEMPAADLRSRLQAIVAGTGVSAAPGMLRAEGIGDLAREEVQARLERCLDGVALVILDNLSSLVMRSHESNAESWMMIQRWQLRLRRRGVSVVVVHHAGKSGDRRGLSNREDLLDTSISLRRPDDYSPEEGARFEVHVAKGRALRGKPALPFEAKLSADEGRAVWSVKAIVGPAGCARSGPIG